MNILEVQNLCKTYGKGEAAVQALRDVTFSVHKGEFVAIVGGSGAGKTTLMNAISGFDKECTGQILFNGHSIKKEFELLKDMIGYVPQQEIIYENLTLCHMLRYTAKMKMPKDTDAQEVDKRINEVLEMVELTEHKDTFIRKLSGGQKKRVAIAGVLAMNPKILILDDSASALDFATDAALRKSLNRLDWKVTTFLVSQRSSSIQQADLILVLDNGTLAGKGTHAELLRTCDTYREIYFSQFPEERARYSSVSAGNIMKEVTV